MAVDWRALDALDKEDLMKKVISHLERPGNFYENVGHARDALIAFLIVAVCVGGVFGSFIRLVNFLDK
jgi:hypothetical protein